MADEEKKILSRIRIGDVIYYSRDDEAQDKLALIKSAAYRDVAITISDGDGKIADAATVKAYVDEQIGQIYKFDVVIVDELPQPPGPEYRNKIYLVPKKKKKGYIEWICVNEGTEETPNWQWEEIGDTDIDLEGYRKAVDQDKIDAQIIAGFKADDIALRTELLNAIQQRVEKQLVGENGIAYIFNEKDGGGAKFVHNDGTESYVGVNDGGENGIAAQIYADKLVDGKWTGAKIDVKTDGIYYTVGNGTPAERDIPENEIAVVKNITDALENYYTKEEQDVTDDAIKADIEELKDEKLNKLPNVDDPEDPGFGWPYHIPYDAEFGADADSINLKLKTITLDGKVTKMSFNKEIPAATKATAGLMSAADKNSLENKEDHFDVLDCGDASDWEEGE